MCEVESKQENFREKNIEREKVNLKSSFSLTLVTLVKYNGESFYDQAKFWGYVIDILVFICHGQFFFFFSYGSFNLVEMIFFEIWGILSSVSKQHLLLGKSNDEIFFDWSEILRVYSSPIELKFWVKNRMLRTYIQNFSSTGEDLTVGFS